MFPVSVRNRIRLSIELIYDQSINQSVLSGLFPIISALTCFPELLTISHCILQQVDVAQVTSGDLSTRQWISTGDVVIPAEEGEILRFSTEVKVPVLQHIYFYILYYKYLYLYYTV